MVTKDIKDSKTGVIYYFSGTGNTFYISLKYKKLFEDKGISMDLLSIEKIDIVASQKGYDLIVVGFPVYAWYPPKMVTDFLEKLPTVERKKAIIFATCESQVGSSLSVARKILDERNYDVAGTFVYKMPSNAGYMFGKDVEKQEVIDQKLMDADKQVINDVNNFFNENRIILKKNIFLRGLHSVINWGFSRQLKKKQWVVNSKCTFCAVCQEGCPTKNITVKKLKKEVKFGSNCMFCARCYNFCPMNAIEYKKVGGKSNKFKRYIQMKGTM